MDGFRYHMIDRSIYGCHIMCAIEMRCSRDVKNDYTFSLSLLGIDVVAAAVDEVGEMNV